MIFVLPAIFSCTAREDVADEGLRVNTYQMKLECSIDGTEYVQTKSVHQWEDGASVQVQFQNRGFRVKGTATYDAATDDWTVVTGSALSATALSSCEVYWFNGLKDYSVDPLQLGPEVAPFKDIAASYSLTSDNYMVITARLSPMTSRIRFVGKPGTTYQVKGLRFCSTYSLSADSFARVSEAVSVKIADNGSSPYYYALFADESKRELSISGEHNTLFVRSFPQNVLSMGGSGYITVPTTESYEKWTMVNADNLEEILLPVQGETVVSEVRGTSADFTSSIVDNGNGTILSFGFVYGTEPSPSIETSKVFDISLSSPFAVRIGGLETLTTYYVRAYSSNPKGLSYGPESTFTTTDERDGINGGAGFGDEENWNSGSNDEDGDSIGKDDWSGDSDWGAGEDYIDGDEIGKDDWAGDTDWGAGDGYVDGDSIGKDDWTEDGDWGNGEDNADGGTIGKDGWYEDEDWNDDEISEE